MKKILKRKNINYYFLIISVVLLIIYLLIYKRNLQKLYLIQKSHRPNFVFILTDDQDSWMGSLAYMKTVNNILVKKGMTFENSFVATPLCCPSRSSILTGQYVHNHRAINNSISGGCNNAFWRNGPEKRTFAQLLHEHGYNNFFAGKYLNQYGMKSEGGLKHIPAGWDWWIGLEGNSKYYNYNLSVNGSKRTHASDPSKDYFTGVINAHALDYINQLRSPSDQPFLMMLSTPACHAPFTPEPKYRENFTQERIPRTPNFNVANDKTKHWLLRLGPQPLSEATVRKLDEIYRQRLRTLLSVDDMVANVFNAIDEKELLDNTYFIFSSDNGYHLGQFSLPLDKREPYEFDVRVPLVIRGPNVPAGISPFPTINVDIAPTILDLAGIALPEYMDGMSLKPALLGRNAREGGSVQRTVLIEHSGESKDSNPGCYDMPGLSGCSPEVECKCSDSRNNTYSCLRHMNELESHLYCRWNDSQKFEEFYDLKNDHNQLLNEIASIPPDRLNALRSSLKAYTACKGSQCRELAKDIDL